MGRSSRQAASDISRDGRKSRAGSGNKNKTKGIERGKLGRKRVTVKAMKRKKR